MKSFLLKAQHFFKRNIYPITVSLCTVLVLTIISVSAYSAINESNNVIDTTKPSIEQNDSTNTDDNKEQEQEPSAPTTSVETIIFDVPFENATISKEYADSKLLYDTTTKLWCTHQGLDFACIEGTNAKAVFDGTITKIENSMMNGTTIYLKINENLTVVYKGLASDISVKEGDNVKKGDVLGKITGFLAEKADGVHLHLELLKNDKLIDPTEYFSFSK